MATITLNLTKEELSFLGDSLAETVEMYNEDGTVYLFENEYSMHTVNNVASKIEEAYEQLKDS